MQFEEALKEIQIEQTPKNTNMFIMSSKTDPQGKVMYRRAWTQEYPIKFLWITQQNCLVYSIGNGMSAPILMEVTEYLADDWEVKLRFSSPD